VYLLIVVLEAHPDWKHLITAITLIRPQAATKNSPTDRNRRQLPVILIVS
jgi:hypothetical protein